VETVFVYIKFGNGYGDEARFVRREWSGENNTLPIDVTETGFVTLTEKQNYILFGTPCFRKRRTEESSDSAKHHAGLSPLYKNFVIFGIFSMKICPS